VVIRKMELMIREVGIGNMKRSEDIYVGMRKVVVGGNRLVIP